MKQKSFHIVLDIEKDMLKDPDFEQLEHEVHRVRRARDGTTVWMLRPSFGYFTTNS